MTTARIKSNLEIKRLPKETQAALDALELPGESGRTIRMDLAWGLPLFQNAAD